MQDPITQRVAEHILSVVYMKIDSGVIKFPDRMDRSENQPTIIVQPTVVVEFFQEFMKYVKIELDKLGPSLYDRTIQDWMNDDPEFDEELAELQIMASILGKGKRQCKRYLLGIDTFYKTDPMMFMANRMGWRTCIVSGKQVVLSIFELKSE